MSCPIYDHTVWRFLDLEAEVDEEEDKEEDEDKDKEEEDKAAECMSLLNLQLFYY